MNSLKCVARTSEYRGLSQLEKGLKLIDEEGASLREAAEAVGITLSSLFRAKKARAENRDVGVPGRPRILNTKEEATLVQAIVDADIAGKPLTYKRLREVV
jgi:transposase